MLKLLIVDDEVYAVEGLRSGVPWSSLGFGDVFEAYNIQDAEDILRRNIVDLVICDIEMPGGDGFELLEWIREYQPDLITLFLTCHADFHYAQRAIQLGCQDYLLKPVDFEEVSAKVRKIAAMIAAEREWKSAQEKAEAFWERKKPLLVERFWQDVLSSRISPTAGPLDAALREYAVPFDRKTMEVWPILISVEQWTQPLSERDEELMEYAVRKVAEEIVLDDGLGCTVQDGSNANAIFIYSRKNGKMNIDTLASRCENFIMYCRNHFYCKVSCYIGESVPLERLKPVYEALLKMEYDNISKSHAVHLYKPGAQSPEQLNAVDLSDWPALIEQGEKDTLRSRIHRSLSELKYEGGRADTLTIYYHSVLQTIYAVLHKRGKTVQEVFAGALPLVQSSSPKSISQMEEWAYRVTDITIRYVQGEEDTIVRKVKLYIQSHLDDRIERAELAELVRLNPAYLSRLFKKETGESLTDYIQAEKMKLSRELLRGSVKPISEIALIAGYGNLSYFSKAFKKQFGVSPMAYRKNRT
ncbi:response regulator transcription factor [Cohnella sp. 56]|uniref:response regulator transcription factor n=1 Tax=Cohnella sp. 56 TaxID=3113722 RepID=UPI0030EA3C40